MTHEYLALRIARLVLEHLWRDAGRDAPPRASRQGGARPPAPPAHPRPAAPGRRGPRVGG